MTAIIGIIDNGTVLIGGDSAGVAGTLTQTRSDPKVFRNGPYVIGYTTSFRMGQLLRHAFDPPAPPLDTADVHRFMCTTFVDAAREALKTGGWARKDNEQEQGGSFLVGVSGRLFDISSDYQVGELADGYTATGSGWEVALGALYASDGIGMSASDRVHLALSAAANFCTGVRPPFTIVSTAAEVPA